MPSPATLPATVPNSEIVVPDPDGELLGVLDIDSPKHARFDAEDEAGVVRLAEIMARLSSIFPIDRRLSRPG